jgi:hypothetical protein
MPYPFDRRQLPTVQYQHRSTLYILQARVQPMLSCVRYLTCSCVSCRNPWSRQSNRHKFGQSVDVFLSTVPSLADPCILCLSSHDFLPPVSIFALLSLVPIPIPLVLIRYGKELRAHSRYAQEARRVITGMGAYKDGGHGFVLFERSSTRRFFDTYLLSLDARISLESVESVVIAQMSPNEDSEPAIVALSGIIQ